MSFGAVVKDGWKKSFDWSGRATRGMYWYFILFYMVVYLVFMALGIGAIKHTLGSLLVGVVGIAFIFPILSVFVRRLHDQGKSGWWYWILLIPLIGEIWIFVLMVLPGDEGPNKYGPPVLSQG